MDDTEINIDNFLKNTDFHEIQNTTINLLNEKLVQPTGDLIERNPDNPIGDHIERNPDNPIGDLSEQLREYIKDKSLKFPDNEYEKEVKDFINKNLDDELKKNFKNFDDIFKKFCKTSDKSKIDGYFENCVRKHFKGGGDYISKII